MEETGPALVAPSPPRPGKHEERAAGRREEEAGKYMPHFGNGEREQRTGSWRLLAHGLITCSLAGCRANAGKAGLHQHDEGDEAVPGGEPSDFVILQAHLFACFETLLNAPPGADRLNHLGERGIQRRKDQIVGFLPWIVEAATHEQGVPSILLPAMQDGKECPIKEPWPLGSFAHGESVPIVRMKHGCLGLFNGHALASIRRLDAYRLITGDGQHKGILMRFEPEAQVQIRAIDTIGHHPGNRDLCPQDPLQHLLGQLTFGLEARPFGNTYLSTSLSIVDPVLGQIELAVDEAVAFRAHVREYVE